MFGLRRKIAELEGRLLKLEEARECAKGNHFWIMVPSAFSDKPPYIRCAACYAAPLEEKKP